MPSDSAAPAASTAAGVFPAPLAIVDLETTGGTPTTDRITEIAIVRWADGRVVDEWRTLVDPGVSIPPEIQRLTGITNAMVRGQPAFEQVADEVAARLEGHLFVAHNARFDYGFLKNAFARAQRAFTADVLCTVRLSRRLAPEDSGHGLDALIERWSLPAEERHRALGDARLVARLIERWLGEYPSMIVAAAVKKLLKLPSLPPQLAPDSLDGIPDAPGVYVFHGVNDLPLYVGKSISLRERIRSHFTSDYRNANDARLSAEVRRIEWEPTAGELGALMLESQWVKTRFPLLNRALRANADSWLIEAPERDDAAPKLVALSAVPPARLPGFHGPFKDKRAARSMLQRLAADTGLCWTMLGLESRSGPCFARQVRKCAGACIGLEPHATHRERLVAALAPWRLVEWPFPGPVVVREDAPAEGTCKLRGSAPAGDHLHLIDQWCHLGTVRDHAALAALLSDPPAPQFDPDVYRLLLNRHQAGALGAEDARGVLVRADLLKAWPVVEAAA